MKKFCAVLMVIILGACQTEAIQQDPIYRETMVRHQRPRIEGEKFDPLETEPRLREIFAEADRRAERKVGNVERDRHFIFAFWKAKKGILEEEFGINWESPDKLNPGIEYGNYGQPQITDLEEESIRTLLSAELKEGQSVVAIWREFEGDVWVTTRLEGEGATQYHLLEGHDSTWRVKSRGELEF